MHRPSPSRVCIAQKQFREDLSEWVQYDRKTALKILNLMEDVLRDPFVGKGKPEPLKHLPGNVWSRRITQEDRLVYRVYEDKVDFLQAKYHY
ncbi:MAG: Txe/YoeB family addiction module toxin [Puniceicoccales bacterium]